MASIVSRTLSIGSRKSENNKTVEKRVRRWAGGSAATEFGADLLQARLALAFALQCLRIGERGGLPRARLGEFRVADGRVIAALDLVADLIERRIGSGRDLAGDGIDRGLLLFGHFRLLRLQKQLIFLCEGLLQPRLALPHRLLRGLRIDLRLLGEGPGVLEVLLGGDELRGEMFGIALPLGRLVEIAARPGIVGELDRLTHLPLQRVEFAFLSGDRLLGALGVADDRRSLVGDLPVLRAGLFHRLAHLDLRVRVVLKRFIQGGLEIVPALGEWVRHE